METTKHDCGRCGDTTSISFEGREIDCPDCHPDAPAPQGAPAPEAMATLRRIQAVVDDWNVATRAYEALISIVAILDEFEERAPAQGAPQEGEALDLEAIESRANAATPGPWLVNKYGGIGIGPYGTDEVVIESQGFNPFYEKIIQSRPNNIDFVAHARQDIPALIREVRRPRSQGRQA